MNICSSLYNTNTSSHFISPNLTSIHNPKLFVPSPNYQNHHQFLNTIIQSVSKSDTNVAEPEAQIKHVYTHTPTNHDLRTPHSRYHFDGSSRKFFEGWYFKFAVPECRQSFCFMYAVQNPLFRKKLSALEEAQYEPRWTGVAAQILGADDKLIVQSSEESQNFWGSWHELMLGNTFVARDNLKSPNKETHP